LSGALAGDGSADPRPLLVLIRQTEPAAYDREAGTTLWEREAAAGLDPAILGHNHSAGLTVCPNGDVLAIFFSASTPSDEYKANTSFVVTRLRAGSELWDFPTLFYDFPDVNDQSALLWTDNGTVHFFGGGAGLN
jgi:hypothetical protein